MRLLFRRAAVAALLLVLAGCSGGSGTAAAPPVFVPTPSPVPTATATATPNVQLPDSVARNAAQGALLAGSAAGVFVPVTGAPRLLSLRRASSRAPRTTTSCSNGFDEQDTTTGVNVTHIVVSLYDDAACTRLRQRATFDFSFGVDTSSASGTITSYDTSGHVTATETVSDAYFFSGGGFAQRKWTDAAGTSTTPFGHTSALCSFTVSQCTLAAITDGPGFETGVVLTATLPTVQPGAGSTVTIPFSGSVRLGTPGSMTIVDTQPFTPPSLTGGGTPVAISGTAAVTFGTTGPSSFTLAMVVGSTPVTGSFANGTATITVAGATATVNADGDGTIRYASGAIETIVDFRITG
jgi:hypothetical protein